jgi:hypothetical protein
MAVNVILGGLLLPLTVYCLTQVSVISGNRFTSEDGLDVWQEIARKANKSEVPPKEVLRWLERHDSDIRRLEEKLENTP